jgi:hypothetical protein
VRSFFVQRRNDVVTNECSIDWLVIFLFMWFSSLLCSWWHIEQKCWEYVWLFCVVCLLFCIEKCWDESVRTSTYNNNNNKKHYNSHHLFLVLSITCLLYYNTCFIISRSIAKQYQVCLIVTPEYENVLFVRVYKTRISNMTIQLCSSLCLTRSFSDSYRLNYRLINFNIDCTTRKSTHDCNEYVWPANSWSSCCSICMLIICWWHLTYF